MSGEDVAIYRAAWRNRERRLDVRSAYCAWASLRGAGVMKEDGKPFSISDFITHRTDEELFAEQRREERENQVSLINAQLHMKRLVRQGQQSTTPPNGKV